jgi:membrane protease YdiL (CAAX protease family)
MKDNLTQIAKQLLSLLGVAVFYYCLRRFGDISLLRTVPFLAGSFNSILLGVFERHVWQFIFSVAALTIISRGNLWSCGINSMNVRHSLAILLGFYAAAICVLAAMASYSLLLPHNFQYYHLPDKLLVMVIHWLSSPVADQILFFGLFQTMLAKFWNAQTPAGSVEIPTVIFITALMFALGRLGLPHYTSMTVEYIAGFGVGIFSGFMYYKTRSLLTPMLAQAFFFGLPDAVQFIFTSLGHRL